MKRLRSLTVGVFLCSLSTLVAQNVSITNYRLVSQLGSNFTYTADLTNNGGALSSVTATVTSTDPFSVRVVSGQDVLNFQPVPANSRVTSSNTFTVYLSNPSAPLDPSKLSWSFQIPLVPIANPGPNRTVTVGSTVQLDGSKSTNPSGTGTLSYSWQFVSLPPGSHAFLVYAGTAMPSFVADVNGNYVIALTVSNGTASGTANVTVSTYTTPPVANAGPNQAVTQNAVVTLDGSASTDPNGLTLTYQWSFVTVPSGCAAPVLSNAAAVKPTFVASCNGTYIAQLVVTDSASLVSAPATVTITTGKVPPVANAGQNQTVTSGSLVQLNCVGTDLNSPQLLPLTYQWTLNTKPAGSSATLASTLPNPTFLTDATGTYVAQCIVTNSNSLSSAPSTVTISTTCTPPTANPGPSQSVGVGALVTLDGTGSGDACHDPLSYSWTLISRPSGSTAVLSNPNTSHPTFTADVAGTYVAQLFVNNGIASSSAATVTITAISGNNGIVFLPGSLTLTGGSGATLLMLPSPAGAGGQVVTLSSSNPNIATVPPSVTIGQGQVGVYISVASGNTSGSTTIVATGGAYSGILPVTVTLPGLSISVDSTTIGLTRTVAGAVTLANPSSSALLVSLVASPAGIVTVQPPSVMIGAGSTTASFSVLGASVGSATITANAASYAPTSIGVSVQNVNKITLPTAFVVGSGQSAAYAVQLAAGAPPGGLAINLVSSDPSKVVVSPATILIPGGSISATAQVTGVAFGSATITASSPGVQGDTQTVTVGTNMSFSQSSVTIYGGVTPSNFAINLSSPAPAGGVTVSLTSSAPAVASVPATVFVPAGQTSAAIPITAGNPGTATITATAPSVGSATATINVTAPQITVGSLSLGIGQTSSLTVTLPSFAPTATTIALSSSDPGKVTVSPATIVIPFGGMTSSVPQVTAVGIGSATITATAAGWSAGQGIVSVSATLNLSPATATVTAGTTQQFTLCLSSVAPAGGLTINLSSSAPAVATLPATVTVPAGTTCVVLNVNAASAGTTTLHASALPAIPDTTATLTVTSSGTITLTGAGTMTVGQVATVPVALSTPPPNPVIIALTSSDPSKATISPSTVTVPAGQTQPAVQPQVTALGVGSVTLGATSPGYSSGSLPITITAAQMTFSPSSLQLSGTQNLTLNLGQPAPVGGFTVNLSSSNTAVATVPASVTFAGGSSSASVPVTSVGAGTATITATGSGVNSATATVTVSAGIVLPNVTLTPGQTTQFPVSLATPAPSGGVFISLVSSNTAAVTINPANVFIPSGGTSYNFVSVTGVALGSSTITASAYGMSSASRVVQVTSNGSGGGAIGTLTLTPVSMTIIGTATQNLTLNLSTPAPTATSATLTSSNPGAATVTATVPIAAGASSVSVPVTGVAPGTTTITASVSGYGSATSTVTDSTSSVPSINVPATISVGPGSTVPFPVTLSAPAPAGGVFISLVSSDPSKASVLPGNILIVQGATAPTSVPQLNGFVAGSATISAQATGYATAISQVSVASTTSLNLAPSTLSLVVGNSGNMTVTLPVQAPGGGQVVTLVSSNPSVATVPATVTVPSFNSGVSVPITSVAIGSTTITASTTGGVGNATATVTVVGAAAINMPSGVRLAPGETVNFPVTLASPAPSGGVFVTLTSSDSNVLSILPSTILFAAGTTTSSTTPRITGVNFGAVSVTAAATGLGSVSQAVTVGATLSFQPSTVVITGTPTIKALQLVLSAPAPAGGLVIDIVSSDTSVLTAPATVTIPAGASNVNVVVQAQKPGTASITASKSPVLSPAAANVTVVAAPSVVLPIFESVGVGWTIPISVSLSAPAPAGGVTITLTSSNTSKFTVSGTAFVPAGATVPLTLPSITAGPMYTSEGFAVLTAAAPGYTTANLDILVVDMITIAMPPNPVIPVGLTVPLPIALPSLAPPGGVTIALTSSDPTRVLIQPSVFIPAGKNQPDSYPLVTGVNFGTATISAVAAGYISGMQPVTVSTTLSFSPATLTLSGGASGSLSLSMSGPAPAGGLTVGLVSSNPAIAGVPASVFIPQNTTTVTVPITGSTAGIATITAVPSVSGPPATTATITRN